MNIPIHKNKKHSLALMFCLVINHSSNKTACKDFLPYGLHIDAMLLFDHQSLLRIKAHLCFYIYNIHNLQISVKYISSIFRALPKLILRLVILSLFSHAITTHLCTII